MLRARSETQSQSFDANETLTAQRFVKFTSGDETEVDLCDTAGETVLGAIRYGASAGDRVSVILRGDAYLVAGGTITAGSKVATDNAGRPVAAVSGDAVAGLCLSGGDLGDLVTIDVDPGEVLA